MIAFVISGGGARICQALVLIERHLERGGKWPDLIVGTSAGGLLAFLLCKRQDINFVRDEVLAIKKRRDLFEGFPFWGLFSMGMWSSKPLQKKLHKINWASYGFKIPGYVCTYDIASHKTVYLKFGEEKAERFASTACIPILVEPMDDKLVDGGLTENTPLKFPIDKGADEIHVFQCSAPEEPNERTPSGKIEMALRCLEAQRLEIAKDDLVVAQRKNDDPSKRVVSLTMHVPKRNYLGVLDFDKINSSYKEMMANE